MQRLKTTASCPSCGAPFELLEGANVARCPYCNLPLLFQSPDGILRYYLKPKVERRSISFLADRSRKSEGKSLPRRTDKATLFYLPFWRFTAQAFYTMVSRPQLSSAPPEADEEPETHEVLAKDWDVNLAGHTSDDLGIATLGMRPDWLNLAILTDAAHLKQKAEVLSLEVDSSAARQKAVDSLEFQLQGKMAPEDELAMRLIEERLSLIYFPLWTVDFVAPEGKFFCVIDAITGRSLKQDPGIFEQMKSRSSGLDAFPPPRIVPHHCPNCGWDLPVTPFHVVFSCTNCGRMWKIHQDGYAEVKGQIARVKEDAGLEPTGALTYYPFWVFEAGLQQWTRSSIQEVFELLPSEIGLFNVANKSRPFTFHIPAFEMANLKKVADVGLAYLRTQPEFDTMQVRTENLKGVLISEDDAKKIAELLWLRLISRRANLDPDKWKQLRLTCTGIVWCPCRKEGTFLRDTVIGYSFQKVESEA